MKAILFACLFVSLPAVACVDIAPEASGWSERAHRLSVADPLRIETTLEYKGVSHSLHILKNGWGMIACLNSMEHCVPLSSLEGPMGSLPDVGLLHGWLTATSSALVFSPASRLPGAKNLWSLPHAGDVSGAWPVRFKDWQYNPEVGYPLPARVEVPARGRHAGFTLTLERFAVGSPVTDCCVEYP